MSGGTHMWITNGTKRVLIDDGAFSYWRSLGWQNDANEDLVGDETAASQQLADSAPAAIGGAAAVGVATQLAREDHVHTGQKLAAIAAPTAPGVVYAQAEAASARTAINAIRAALTAHGITL